MSAHTPQPGTRGARIARELRGQLIDVAERAAKDLHAYQALKDFLGRFEHYREKAKYTTHGMTYGMPMAIAERFQHPDLSTTVTAEDEAELSVPPAVPKGYKGQAVQFYRKHAEFLANLCRLARIEKRQERKLAAVREEGWLKEQNLLQEQIGELKVEIIHLRKTIHLLTK